MAGTALRIDASRRLLWATTGYVPHGESVQESDTDKTALLAFDLASGAPKQRIPSPVPGLRGDMTIGRHGDLYVSEGIHGAVLWLKPGAATFDRLDTEGEFPSPQTPALSADERPSSSRTTSAASPPFGSPPARKAQRPDERQVQ